MKLYPIILAGGVGTRLWPLSREHYPKQFLQLFGNQSLLQDTLLRLQELNLEQGVLEPLIICNEAHRFLVATQCAQVQQNVTNIILEPKGRNTAPALTIAAFNALQLDDDPILMMMPADHLIQKTALFHQIIKVATEMAAQDYLLTFGIKPAKPETGYGYIHIGEPIQHSQTFAIHQLNGFTEKPDEVTAQKYLASGDYVWNSGIFMMKASVWLAHIQSLQAEIYTACEQAYAQGKVDGLFYRLDEAAFLSSPNDSIDYAIMEKLARLDNTKLAVMPIDVDWSDVGCWESVWDIKNKDSDGNYIEGDVIQRDTKNCFVKSERGLIVTIGCHDLAIVDSDNAIMIADKRQTQDVKQIVALLKDQHRAEASVHNKVYRPWGSYQSVDQGDNFQVKRLTVNSKMKLSLQLHHQRAEHWVVVAGTATVTRGDEVFELKQNESTFIPLGVKHRLENKTDQALEIIEVQCGSYLGEDDIVRFDDDFGRA